MQFEAWAEFQKGEYTEKINVKNFIQTNYTPYEGDESFLAGATERTEKCLKKVKKLLDEERARGGVWGVDTERTATVLAYPNGYIDKKSDLIVGLQTDEPLKRGVNPFGGMRMARSACEAYGYKVSEKIEEEFRYRTTHNDGVFSVYTPEMRLLRKYGLLTGLPDAYGRGRIIGDYRRVALYGVDVLIDEKEKEKLERGESDMTEGNIRCLEELHAQITALNDLKTMAANYGYDISLPAKNAKEAIQWLYFGYLGSIKEQNGAAMSLGRTSTFLDIYMERDLKNGVLTEEGCQELMDDFVLKLRVARHLRTPEYNDLFGGDPMWITESIGGMGKDGRTLVTKNSFRILHTLENLGPAPEPNMTVLWAQHLPEGFKKYCAKVSVLTDSVQYENDDLMRPMYGDDYGIACCVSAMRIGKQMQFFGARCNFPKLLLLALNGGKESCGTQIAPQGRVFTGELKYDEVMEAVKYYRAWLTRQYVNTMNVIHYMHDKHCYEKVQMALHDTDVERVMAFGVAGLSVFADSMSAIKYAKVTPILNEHGLADDFKIEGEFPCFGNDDDRVDNIAKDALKEFYADLVKTPAYRDAQHTLSVLTITSNVMYGKKTGNTPDGRRAGEPFAPGANPMHNRDCSGAFSSLNSVAKLPYFCCKDGISNTFSIVPRALGDSEATQIDNLVRMMDGYFVQGAHHLNVNVLDREKLIDAMDHPENYPNLTVRVSGYAVNFYKLSRAQQAEVIRRTFHERF